MAKAKLDENLVAESIREIIERLQVPATIEVSRQDSIFFVDIDSEDSSLLIGRHGVNLESLQFILAVRIKTLTGDDDFEIYVDVGGWRKKKDQKCPQKCSHWFSKTLESPCTRTVTRITKSSTLDSFFSDVNGDLHFLLL